MYEPLYEEESGGGGFVLGLLCGAALGAAIGLMFAPKKGTDFRQTIYESTGDLRRKAYDAYGQANGAGQQRGCEGPPGGRARPRGIRQCAAIGDRRQWRRRIWRPGRPSECATDFSAPRPSSGRLVEAGGQRQRLESLPLPRLAASRSDPSPGGMAPAKRVAVCRF